MMELEHVLKMGRVFLTFALFLAACSAKNPHRRFEYKYSFKGPHLVQRDGTIPFWEHGGHAIASDESIRITPSLRSKKGHVWTKEKAPFDNWEVEVVFRISGRGRIGADGLAIWYTEEKGTDGPVFGSSDMWKGLAIFFDSFDNDAQHNNPYIMVMNNDGTQRYDHNTDGMSQQMGGCLRDFRNKPFPIRAKIEYYQGTLTVLFHNGMTNNKDDFEMCLRAENVELPKGGYFGVSAATGGLADDHDVQAFLTHSLTAPTDGPADGGQVSDDERKRFEQEFEEYWEKLQKAKEDYQKEHPDKRPPVDYENEKEWFETQDQRELKMIFDAQTAIHQNIRDLQRKLDEVIGRQERTLSQLSLIGQGGGAPAGGHSGGAPGLPPADTIKRHEVDQVLNTQRDLIKHMKDIKVTVGDIHGRGTDFGGNQGQGQGLDQEVKNYMKNLHSNVQTLMNKPQGNVACPTPEVNCLSPLYFFIFMFLQLVILVGYSIYRSNKEASAKKFY